MHNSFVYHQRTENSAQRVLLANREYRTVSSVAQPSTRKRGLLKLIIVSIALFLLAEALFFFFILPAVSIAQVRFVGNSSLSHADLCHIAGITDTTKWAEVNALTVSQRLVSFPWIAQAEVVKQFPDQIDIRITEREAVAITFTTINNETVAMEIDKTGTIFKINRQSLQTNLPIITGLQFEHPREGMQVHHQLIPLFARLDRLEQENPRLLAEISEIRIAQKKYGGYDLIVYPIRFPVAVSMDKNITEQQLRYMLLLLDVYHEVHPQKTIGKLDIRGGTAVYRAKGETSHE